MIRIFLILLLTLSSLKTNAQESTFMMGESGYEQFLEAGIGYGSVIESHENEINLTYFSARWNPVWNFWKMFSFGNSVELRASMQLSEADADNDDYEGYYYHFLSPFLAFEFWGLSISYEFRLQGEYIFTAENEQGDSLTLHSPSGSRFALAYPTPWGTWGLYYEAIEFEKQKGGFLGDTDIVNGQEMNQFGVSYRLSFGGDGSISSYE